MFAAGLLRQMYFLQYSKSEGKGNEVVKQRLRKVFSRADHLQPDCPFVYNMTSVAQAAVPRTDTTMQDS